MNKFAQQGCLRELMMEYNYYKMEYNYYKKPIADEDYVHVFLLSGITSDSSDICLCHNATSRCRSTPHDAPPTRNDII